MNVKSNIFDKINDYMSIDTDLWIASPMTYQRATMPPILKVQ